MRATNAIDHASPFLASEASAMALGIFDGHEAKMVAVEARHWAATVQAGTPPAEPDNNMVMLFFQNHPIWGG